MRRATAGERFAISATLTPIGSGPQVISRRFAPRAARYDAENLFPADADTSHLRNVLELFKAHSQVRYCPSRSTLTVPITLFRTSIAPAHLPAIAGDECWGWEAHGRVEVHGVPGEHLTVLRAPHVAALAQKLSATLKKRA